MNRRLTPLTGAAVGALIAVSALAGCSAHPGQAAVMTYTDAQGERQHLRLGEDRVQSIAAELGPLGVSPGHVVQTLTDAPFVERVARDNGLEVSAEDARAELEAVQAQNQVQDQGQAGAAQVDVGSLSDDAVEVIRLSLLTSQINQLPQAQELQGEYQAWRRSSPVSYSPRYTGQARSWILDSGVPGLPQG